MKILTIAPSVGTGTGGETIRKRNLSFFENCVGHDKLHFFALPFYAFYAFTPAECGGLSCWLSRKKRDGKLLLRLYWELLRFRPDVLYLDHSRIRLPFGAAWGRKLLVFFHNIEQNYERHRGKNSGVLLPHVIHAEKTLCRKATACICINERDSWELERLYGRRADYILPISFTDSFTPPLSPDDGSMLFVGSDFYGNTEGLFRFIENCLEPIGQRLVVVGSGMEKYQKKYPDKNVEFLGYAENLASYYEKAACVILPIFSGSGMKTKTCEALMYGKRIFGTPEAFEGYRAIEEADCIICRDEKDFIEALLTFYKDRPTAYSERSRQYFLNNYETGKVEKDYLAFLTKTLGKIGE